MRHGSLFSGIGGFDLAAQWMGWENVFHCEWNPFGQKVLKYYWPNAISYEDITKSDFTIHRGTIDIITGGFPCQPFSTAGKRQGTDDDRYLWPEMLRVIREVQPRYIVGENVRGLVSWDGGLVFDTVCADVEAEGYEVLPVLLPAASVNAPHRRDRVWFIAFKNTNQNGWRSHKRKKQSEKWEQRNTCSGTDEPLSAYYDKNESFVDFNNSRGSDGLGQVQRADGEISERNNDAESCDSGNWNASDTNSIGYRGRSQQSESDKHKEWKMDSDEQQYRNGVWGKVERCSGDASNPNGHRLEGSISPDIDRQVSTEKEHGEEHISTHGRTISFQNFPTVSPVCNGDDGLSDRLDGITFSKWRKESIKGGGNAIVPQVAFQIFKVIQKMENE